MNHLKITYWTTTIMLALLSVASAFGYLTQTPMQQSFLHLGFPSYFRVELALAKLVGAVALLAPVGGRYKEWAYSGFAITYLSAFIAHRSVADPLVSSLFPLLALGLLVVSYQTYHRRLRVRPLGL
ncbi:DoxX family protein [Larkinella soli]|uniref:DoxX family protein n=1 Tax=Larkinella soli TaxID=1770527 RepID=UPI000FFBABC6|nr:DoxX family protein [Larkinella soli]